DTVGQTGEVLFSSLLYWEACMVLAKLCQRVQDHDGAHTWFEAAERAGENLDDFREERDGMMRAEALVEEIGFPAEVVGPLKVLVGQFLRNLFVNSGGARYLPQFSAETVLIEDFPEDQEPPAPGELLAALARLGNGSYAALAIDDGDLDRLLVGSDAADLASGAALTKSDIQADGWKDMGAWLLWIPLALAPFAFRRGWAAALLGLLFVQLAPAPAHAIDLDVFERPDQKGARAFAEGRFAESVEHFQDPAWQAAPRYRAGDFARAAETLAAQPDAAALYNLGNALAKAGKLEEAVAAYDRTLAAAPNDEDARFNRDLVKKLLEEQPPKPQEPKDKPSESQQDSSDQKGKSSESKGESGDPQQQASDSQHGSGDSKESKPQDGSPDQKAGDPSDSGADDRHEDAASDEKQGEGKDAQTPDQVAANDPGKSAGEAAEPRPDETERAQPGSPQAGEPGNPVDPSQQAPDGDDRGMTARPPSAADQQRSQWMARLPDDPGGLLRERIRRDYLRKQGQRRGEGGS
ncbi:MAG: tetratricopeptide repeat protein, partial [Proteobacteria bacterium]|nr:tetratricopeptide repeat protein [Pseudomonadota bacterium]